MKKLFISALFVAFSLSINVSFANSSKDDMAKCQVSGGMGSLMVEAGSKMIITIKNEEGKLILSEISSTDTGKLQLLGLSTGYYDVEIKSKKSSKVFRVEVQ